MMLLLGSLLLCAVSIIRTERMFFYKPNATTWDDARLHCQACYQDLTTITPTTAQTLMSQISQNFTEDCWIGLRQNISSSKFWSRWANGEPVIYQNWYPGHPVPKKIPVPPPTCPCPPPPPISNHTDPDVMQCPAFARLCECLNNTETDYVLKSDNNCTDPEMMCPALAKLCDCLNSSDDTPITVTPTMFTTTHLVTSSTTMLVSPSSTTSIIIINDLEPQYIEDSCVALLNFGMWQEKQCNESLPYVCYDDRFYGNIEISNKTKSGGILSWSTAGINISQYKVQINGNYSNATNATSYQIEGLAPGTLYSVQVIPVKCDRDLNPQNVSFYTLPEEIRNLSIVDVGTHNITLSWSPSRGTSVVYSVTIDPGNSNTTCHSEKCSISNLEPGQMHNFKVAAVVNETIFGEPGYISNCTKPSKVVNLTSSNNNSYNIIATWDSPDGNSGNYIYNVILGNGTTVQSNSANLKYINMFSLIPGSNYTLNVSVSVPNCHWEGETTSISAYTTPMQVSNLTLSSQSNNITAKWLPPEGKFSWFSLHLSSNMSQNIPTPNATTTDLSFTFKNLKPAVFYNVSVITYVTKDLSSTAVSNSNYTKPVAPGKVVATVNNVTVNLTWEPPANSEGVINISYLVNYSTSFWGNNVSEPTTGKTSYTFHNLKPGTKHKFSVSVCAGGLESAPSETTGFTEPSIRKLTLAMLCSSSTQLYCMEDSTMKDTLTQLNNTIYRMFQDYVFWKLTLKNSD